MFSAQIKGNPKKEIKMRVKKLIASALSFVLCIGNMTAAYAAAETMQTTYVHTKKFIETAAESSDNSASVVTIKLGDVNGDSFIDAADASAVLSAYAKLSIGAFSDFTLMQTVASDVNKDSIIDAVDASNILSYYAYASTLKTSLLPIESFMKNKSEAGATTTTTTS